MEERTKLHENLASTSDLSMNNVHTDYFLSFIPTKLKPPSGEKAKKKQTMYECIDPNLYHPQANMVAFRVTTQRLAFWKRSLQIIYYEHYGKQFQYVVNLYDNPQDWSIKSSGNKAICIEMSTKNPSNITDNPLIYKVTFFSKYWVDSSTRQII